MSEQFDPLVQAKQDAQIGKHIYDLNMQPNPGDMPADNVHAAQDMVDYLESRPSEDDRGKRHDPATGKFVNGDKYFDEGREDQYGESMPKSHEEKSLSDLTKEWADAESHGDRTMAGDIQDAVIDRILGQENISDDHKQELLDRIEKKKEAIKAEKEKDGDEAEKKEDGETLRASHEIVQHEPNADGLCRLGLEYALEGQEGAEVDWNMQKWSRDSDPSRQIVITTGSGNRYYVTGDRIYDLRASSERNRPVYFDIEELPNAKLGRGWDIPGFRNTSTVQKVEVGYKYVHEGVELGEKRGIDPFNAAELFLAGLDGDGEEPIEAIVVDEEHGDEIPEGGFDLPDDAPVSDEVSKRGGIRNAMRRAKAALVAGTGRLFGGARGESGEDREKMSKGKKRALGILAVGVAIGAGYAIYKGLNSGGGGGNGSTARDAAERALTGAGRNSGRAAEAQQAIIDSMSPEQRDMFSAMMDWQMNFMKDNGMDMNDPANWEKAAKMFTKGVTYASTRGQGGSLPMTS